MLPVIQTGMVFHDISTKCVCSRADNRAAKSFSINLFLAEHLYMGSWFQCLVCVLEHDSSSFSLTYDAHGVPRIAGVVLRDWASANVPNSETLFSVIRFPQGRCLLGRDPNCLIHTRRLRPLTSWSISVSLHNQYRTLNPRDFGSQDLLELGRVIWLRVESRTLARFASAAPISEQNRRDSV